VALIGQGMAVGGPPAAMELFLRWAAGEAAFASIDPAVRDRYLGNGELFLHVKMPPFLADLLAAEAIADAPAPIVAAASRASRDPASPHHSLYQAASWLAGHLGTDLVELTGGHTAYLTEPVAVADSLRPLLRALCSD